MLDLHDTSRHVLLAHNNCIFQAPPKVPVLCLLSPLQACVRLPSRQHVFMSASYMCRNAEIEAQIAHLRAELLHKEQENDRVQLQLTQEKEERERAQRKVNSSSIAVSGLAIARSRLHCIAVSYDAS